MQAPAIDKRSYADLVAWTELLARCPRGLPGPALVGAVLDQDVLDPAGGAVVHTEPAAPGVEPKWATAGTLVDRDLAAAIAGVAWVDLSDVLAGRPLGQDVVNPANGRVYPAGTVVDAALAGVLEDLARIAGPGILVGCVLDKAVRDPFGDLDQDGAPDPPYKAGTTIDEALAAVLDRLAWVRVRSWQPPADGPLDPGQALVRIAGRFAELVVERINRAPERHELAFLNLTGAQPLPPRPARVPLTFALAPSSPVDAVVAAGTQVTASALEGEEDEVVFETERSLVVTRSQLQAVVVSDAETDQTSDRTPEAEGTVDRPWAVFSGDQPTPHQLFVACDSLLTAPGTKAVTLILRSAETWQWLNWPIAWSRWDEDTASWLSVTASTTVSSGACRVALTRLPPLVPSPVGERTAGWLRAQLTMLLPPGKADLVPDSVASGNHQPDDPTFPYAPFGDATPTKFFYLNVDEAVGAGRVLVRLRVALGRAGTGSGVKLNWTYKVGGEWRSLGQSSPGAALVGASTVDFNDGTRAFTRAGDVTFHAPAEWPRELYRNRMGRWLRVEVADEGTAYATRPRISTLTVSSIWELPQVTGVTVQLNQTPQAQAPEAAAADATPLDLSKDILPFGEEPAFNDTLYLALPESLARPRTTVRLRFTLSNPVGNPAGLKEINAGGSPQVAWEVADGRTWRALAVPEDPNVKPFTASSVLTMTLPDSLAPAEVNGEERHWIRARLVGGNYGVPATYTPYTQQGNTYYRPEKATFGPPIIKNLTFEPVGAAQPEAPPSACLTYNDFTYTDQTTAAVGGPGGGFTPFTTTSDQSPALYLGFDRPFGPQPTTLYLQVEPPLPEDVAADQLAALDPTTLAQLTWEYAGPRGWRPLGAADETEALARRGLVTFVGPDDLTPRACFGQTRHWLRARWHRGYFPWPPRLRRLLLNTTWAGQTASVTDEILGSSNGNPGQVFTTAQAPVQPGQQVVVREQEQPAAEERAALVAVEGPDAVTVTRDAGGQVDEIWARWHAVGDFYGSGPRDRHYTLDPLTGDVRFGDGRNGLIPPQGQNNILATYRTGGGEQGNRATETIVQLTSGVPYIDSVTNHEPSEGGAPREPIDRLRARSPQTLRHRDRAVTAQDLEDLAYAASTAVARASAVAPGFDPYNLWLDAGAAATDDHRAAEAGRMGVIVVPTSPAARPTPSLGLIADVQAYLQARCPPTADLWVAGPEWVRVTVRATVVPTSLETADAAGVQARAALDRFLHPLTGGPQGQGWAFGRKPHRSDLFALIEGIAGIDHVEALTVSHEPETQNPNTVLALQAALAQSLDDASKQPPDAALRRWLDRSLVYSGTHQITVALPHERPRG